MRARPSQGTDIIGGETTECTMCDVTAASASWQDVRQCPGFEGTAPPDCKPNTCHNNGRWVNVASPQVRKTPSWPRSWANFSLL